MRQLRYKNKAFELPRFLNGKALRDSLAVPMHRSLYSTDHEGNNHIINNNDQIDLDKTVEVSDVPYTERG